jgi:hypothetical protein
LNAVRKPINELDEKISNMGEKLSKGIEILRKR